MRGDAVDEDARRASHIAGAAHAFATIRFGLYASAAYRDKLKAGELNRQFGDRRFSFRTGSQTTQATAARADCGIALLPRYILSAQEPDLVEVSLGGRNATSGS